jgi:hypothetical protein
MADGAVEEEGSLHEEDIAERDRALPSSALTRPKDDRAPPSVENDAEPGEGGRRVTGLWIDATYRIMISALSDIYRLSSQHHSISLYKT